MGFNISGIAISKNYKDDFDSLQKELNWTLQFFEEIDFEKASENWKEEEICDVYFAETGTLLLINADMCMQPWKINNANTFTFVLSETSMSFSLSYCEGTRLVRTIMEAEGKQLESEGNELEVEKTAQDTSEIIWKQIENVLGKNFWAIDEDEVAFRYNFVP